MTAQFSSGEVADLYCATCERQFTHGTLCPHDGTRLVRLAAAVDPLLGRELDGRFTILEKLGQGGMGAVYRARQHSMGREVAIKVLSASLVSDATSIKRFLREAKLASRLAHPNVVSVLDFGQTPDGVFYLVMELVEGQTLQEVLDRENRLPLPRMIRIATQICDALEGAHALPIVHRDLKPANVMVLAQGRDLVKVVDFGLAKSLSPEHSGGTTTAGGLLGTPTFMPPEVANGLITDHRADLYSLGCMMYAMGSGRPPFVTDSIVEMISFHAAQPAPPMTGVPGPIAAVVERLLHKDPERRYQTAAEVRSALEDAYERTRGSQPVPIVPWEGPPAMPTPPPVRPTDRSAPAPGHVDETLFVPPPSPGRRGWRPLWIAAIVLGVLATAVVIAASVSSLPDPDRPEGGAYVAPPAPPSTPPAPPSTPPAPPVEPPAPPVVDQEVTPPTPPTVPEPSGKRDEPPIKRPTGRKKPGTIKTTPTPIPVDTTPAPPIPEPRDTGSGSGVRPGAGSNAPF